MIQDVRKALAEQSVIPGPFPAVPENRITGVQSRYKKTERGKTYV